MKKLFVLCALTASSAVYANASVSVDELSNLPIQDASQLQLNGHTTVGGLLSGEAVTKGQIIIGDNGLSAFEATGEVIVQLASFADADEVAKTHGLTLKQAYKSFYVVTSSKQNLTEVVESLKQEGTVLSANLGLKNLDTKIN
ncbi:hypothetical protein PSECIP111951_02434 [Pseudoalteromonas holothuriae]|uniref:ASP external chaperone domain-containing protein n=1 Tax=Pseudoalteromonas holothuriae TaxID=2963714 RepID=A0ABN8UMB8_9GAMM|nr:hypothetical protein [Pseudoalteromonas sp. CIP111951]CAH9061184.1 hypothetical protein PSECIP111951_02434 [Pseudoalteromonas sp. CIP111951]